MRFVVAACLSVTIAVGLGAQALGLIGIADAVKPSTPQAIASLRKDGIRVVMVTGDNQATAKAVADQLGIPEVRAEVLPDQKADLVQQLQQEGRVVAMAGDPSGPRRR